MRLADAVTCLSVLNAARNEQMLLVQRFKDKLNVAYHIGCMRGRVDWDMERKAQAIAGTTETFAVYLLDDVGPHPYCRECEVEHWSCALPP